MNGIPINRETLSGVLNAAQMVGVSISEIDSAIAQQAGTTRGDVS